jgi:hypothetical protein
MKKFKIFKYKKYKKIHNAENKKLRYGKGNKRLKKEWKKVLEKMEVREKESESNSTKGCSLLERS